MEQNNSSSLTRVFRLPDLQVLLNIGHYKLKVVLDIKQTVGGEQGRREEESTTSERSGEQVEHWVESTERNG